MSEKKTISRRDFLKATGVVAGAALASTAAACAGPVTKAPEEKPTETPAVGQNRER